MAPGRASIAIQLMNWLPGPLPPPPPGLEGRPPPRRPPPRRAQDHADAQVHDAEAFLRRRARRRFPVAAHFGQEARARRAVFAQDLVAAVAVVADGRGADEGLRRLLQPPPRPCPPAPPLPPPR